MDRKLRPGIVSCRLLPEEEAALAALAKREVLANASEAVRLAIREAAQRRGLWTQDKETLEPIPQIVV